MQFVKFKIIYFFIGVTLTEVFLAHGAVQIILLGIQMSLSMYVLYSVYDSPFIGDPLTTALLLLLQGISGLAFGKNFNLEIYNT